MNNKSLPPHHSTPSHVLRPCVSSCSLSLTSISSMMIPDPRNRGTSVCPKGNGDTRKMSGQVPVGLGSVLERLQRYGDDDDPPLVCECRKTWNTTGAWNQAWNTAVGEVNFCLTISARGSTNHFKKCETPLFLFLFFFFFSRNATILQRWRSEGEAKEGLWERY